MNRLTSVRFKIFRGNIFLLISNFENKLIFNKSCGNLGFKNIEKRSNEAFQILLNVGIQKLLNVDNKELFIKIEGAKKETLIQIYDQFINVLKSFNIKIFAIKIINKVSHNGCRKPYFRK